MVGRAGGNNFDSSIKKGMKPQGGSAPEAKQQSNTASSTNAAPGKAPQAGGNQNQWHQALPQGQMPHADTNTGPHPDTMAHVLATHQQHVGAIHAHLKAIGGAQQGGGNAVGHPNANQMSKQQLLQDELQEPS